MPAPKRPRGTARRKAPKANNAKAQPLSDLRREMREALGRDIGSLLGRQGIPYHPKQFQVKKKP